MNYEQKYKQALDRAQQAVDKGYVSQNFVDDIFPELKESEDEKIRKTIYGWIYTQPSEFFDNGFSKEEMLAWVEKQADKDKLICELGEYKVKYTQKVLQEDLNKNTESQSQPKFKVRDWIVDDKTPNDVFYVIEVLEEIYKVIDIDGDDYHIPHCKADKQFHLWTIDDAKDGDVLMTTKTRNCPFIYRKTDYNNNLAYYYAGVDGNGDFCEGCLKRTMFHFGSVADITPATKEQRDLLFQKMEEEGYKWDSEKKELKKIEPKKLDADKWISVEEELPKDWEDERLFALYTEPMNEDYSYNGRYRIGEYDGDKSKFYLIANNRWKIYGKDDDNTRVTHWMPLPAPPHHIIDVNKMVENRVIGSAEHIQTALDVLNKERGEE